MKRILLFLATNLAVMLLLSVVVHLVGADRWLTANGLNYEQLLIFAAIFGFGGSFFSLAISKPMAKWSMGVKVIDNPSNQAERWLVQTVERQARAAGIGMPEVGVFQSPDPNAFATGMSRNSSLVAVSTGLLNNMTQEEVEAVLGHEVSHIANGDMVTLTLIQGVVNTFVIFAARVIGYAIDKATSRDGESTGGMGYFLTVMVLELVLGVFASMIVAWFSRQREFRADAGGASLAGRQKMISALQRLSMAHEPAHMPEQMAAFGIRPGASKFGKLFMSHPPIEERIEALRAGR